MKEYYYVILNHLYFCENYTFACRFDSSCHYDITSSFDHAEIFYLRYVLNELPKMVIGYESSNIWVKYFKEYLCIDNCNQSLFATYLTSWKHKTIIKCIMKLYMINKKEKVPLLHDHKTKSRFAQNILFWCHIFTRFCTGMFCYKILLILVGQKTSMNNWKNQSERMQIEGEY